MKVEIIAVGTELLLGNIWNGNAQYLGKRLAELGIFVYYSTVVGDNEGRLKKAYGTAFNRADLVITTGGLGPTKDDLTKEVGASFFNRELVFHEESFDRIKSYFKGKNIQITPGNKKQAYFPKDSIILPNYNGTAPGCIIEDNGKILVMLPGPPKEMQAMFETSVVPYLGKFSDGVLVSKVLRLSGIGEGYMADVIADIIDKQENPTIAPYAKQNEVTLRITAKAENEDAGNELIKPVEAEIRERIGEYIYGEGETSMEEVVGKILIDNKLTISTAESCTGGLLASKLINCKGISASFMEGAVTYSNEAKIKRLNVKKETLEKFGAVSHETAAEMAKGIAINAGTDIGISTTGVAGPDGGTEEKPVGRVYIGLYIKGEVKTEELNLLGDRQAIRNRAVMEALNWIRRMYS